MLQKLKHIYFKGFFISFFLIAISEIIAEFFSYNPIIYVTKPLIPLSLMLLYWMSSCVKSKLFIAILLCSAITNLFFIPHTSKMLLYGVMSFTVLRLLMLVLILKLVKVRNLFLFFTATLLFLGIFTYLYLESNAPSDSTLLLIFHNFMISIFGGVALSNYIKNDNQQNSYLLICYLLFMGLQLIIFVEKYSLQNSNNTILRPIAMILNILAFYSFYKFVVFSENIKQQ